MTKVKLQPGMKFQHNPIEKGNEFRVEKYDFYDDGNPIWVAVCGWDMYDLNDICLENYMPMVDGKWVNEPIEYEF